MKKRNIIMCAASILLILGFISILVFESNRNTFTENGITYALTVDGVKQNNFPSKGMYRVDTECINATCSWDYEEWFLRIKDIKGDVSSNITFTTITKNNFNDYIIGLSGTTQGIGQLMHETFTNASGTLVDTGYRYEGQDPNNYVWFNNELWRMIGVFDENTHAQNDDTSTSVKENQLVKLIRANPIGGFSLNNATSSNWSGAMLYKLLNPVSGDANSGVYYNKKNGMENSYCYAYYPTVPGKCDFTNIGLDSTYRNMINPVMWKSGARSGSLLSEIYNSERTTDTVNTYIGLIYLSDYGFSVLESNCPRSTNMGSYNSPSCAGQSWLFGQGDEWVLSASSYGDYIRYDGINYSSDPTEDKAVRPTIYLNANVYAIGGTGTEIDPYIIAM